MTDLSKEQVQKVARLARITLSDDEVIHFGSQLSEVIDYNINLLSEVDVANVSPTSQTTGLENIYEEDDVRPSLSQDEALSEAPHCENGQFKVLKVLADS
jgi:aspartyl-tRNA(Asn)/glutamyl-tRNA(Gln) amidotransferase subunit C